MAFEIVVVGTSSGGLKALQSLLSGLPEEFPLPLVIVQHRGRDSEPGLCEFLDRGSTKAEIFLDDGVQATRGG